MKNDYRKHRISFWAQKETMPASLFRQALGDVQKENERQEKRLGKDLERAAGAPKEGEVARAKLSEGKKGWHSYRARRGQ